MPPKIALVTYCYLSYDAVSTDVRGMQECARKLGYEAEVFAEYFPPEFAGQIHSIHDLPSFIESPENLIIYHFSIGWNNGERLISGLSCRKWVKFHNITPPEFFEGVETFHAYSCRIGRGVLPELRKLGATLFLSDSQFNRSEIDPHLPPETPSFVLPPFHQIDVVALREVDELHQRRHPFFLAVGRLAPNKRIDFIIEALAKTHLLLKHHGSREPLPQLVIVGRGDPQLQSYTDYLIRLAKRLDVQDALIWKSNVTREDLESLYDSALALVIASEHEGFCVPVVEAFAKGCPVISSTKTALQETAGTALTFSPFDSAQLASCMLEVQSNTSLREHLVHFGRIKFQARYSVESIGKEFERLLGEHF